MMTHGRAADADGPEDRSTGRSSGSRDNAFQRNVRRLVSVFDSLDRFVFMPICFIAIMAMMLLVTGNGIARYMFGASISGAAELTENLLMPAIVFLGLGFVGAFGAHAAVDFLVVKVSGRTRRCLVAFFEFVGAAILLGIALPYLSEVAAQSAVTVATLVVPAEYTYAVVSAGCLFGAMRMLLNAMAELAGVPRTTFVGGVAEHSTS